MKAMAYLARFRDTEQRSGFKTALEEMATSMCNEVIDLVRARGCQRPSAVMACIEEMNDRWNCICKKEKRLFRDQFLQAWIQTIKAKGYLDKKEEPLERETDPVDAWVDA